MPSGGPRSRGHTTQRQLPGRLAWGRWGEEPRAGCIHQPSPQALLLMHLWPQERRGRLAASDASDASSRLKGVWPELATKPQAKGSVRPRGAAAALTALRQPHPSGTVGGALDSSLQGTEGAPVHVASACSGCRNQRPSAEQSVLGRGAGGAPASQACYLVSLASEPSFEDVGRDPPLRRSLALASEASAGAQSRWRAEGRPTWGRGRGRGGAGPDQGEGPPPACRCPALPWPQALLLSLAANDAPGPLPCRPRNGPHTPSSPRRPLRQAACGPPRVRPAAHLPEGLPSTESDPSGDTHAPR